MAKKNKKPKGLSKEDKALNDRIRAVREADSKAARETADRYYSPGSLPRISKPGDVEGISPATRVRDVNTESTNINKSIAQGEQAYTESRQRDQHVVETLKRMQEGLMGYDAPEMQSQREQARREIRSQETNTNRALKQMAGSSGISGQALTSEMRRVRRASQQAVSETESDLVAKNAEEKRARLGQYGQFANEAYSTHENVKLSNLQALNTQRESADRYRLDAEKANQGADSTNAQNEIEVGKTNAQIRADNIKRGLDVEGANATQREKEIAGAVGIETSDPAVSEAYRNRITQENLAKEQIQVAREGLADARESKKTTQTKSKTKTQKVKK